MAVEAVVFDVSGTLIAVDGSAQAGIAGAIKRLRDANIRILTASNEPRSYIDAVLKSSGLAQFIDDVVTRQDVGKSKGSPAWTDKFVQLTSLEPNQFFYVGDSDYDMVTATRGPMVYAHAAWSKPAGAYGLVAPHPNWVAAVVLHIFRKRHLWYWSLDCKDARSDPVLAATLLNANGAGSDALRAALLRLLKDNQDAKLGPITLKEFVMLHMLASVYGSGVLQQVDFWTTYPGHSGVPNTVMGNFVDVAAKLFRQRYLGKLFDRHTVAERSSVARKAQGRIAALRNQIETVRLNPGDKSRIVGKKALVLDNYLTQGYSTETARNLLLQAGAIEAHVMCVGKYGPTMDVVTRPDEPWDPFQTQPPDASHFRILNQRGSTSQPALSEFIQSFQAMLQEKW